MFFKNAWQDVLNHVKSETQLLKISELLHSTPDELHKYLQSACISLDRNIEYYQLNNSVISDKIIDFQKALGRLWTEWHMQLVRTTIRNLVHRQKNRIPDFILSIKQQAMQSKILRTLKKGKVSIERKVTPLVIAICMGRLEMCQVLVANGAVVTLYEVVFSIWCGNVGVFQFIAGQSANFSTNTTRKGESQSTLSEELAQQSSAYMHKAQYLKRPLIDYAFRWNTAEIIESFISSQQVLPLSSKGPISLVESLVSCCSVETFKMVISRNPVLAVEPIWKSTMQTPLHLACSLLKFSTVEYLVLERKVDLNAVDALGKLPLHHCLETFARLLKLHATGKLAELSAQFVAIVTLLVRNGTMMRINSKEGYTPLCFLVVVMAAWPWMPQLIQMFIDAGADIDEIVLGDSLLHMCAKRGMTAWAQVLLKNGAKIVKDAHGHEPAKYADEPTKHAYTQKPPPLRNLCIRVLASQGKLPQEHLFRL